MEWNGPFHGAAHRPDKCHLTYLGDLDMLFDMARHHHEAAPSFPAPSAPELLEASYRGIAGGELTLEVSLWDGGPRTVLVTTHRDEHGNAVVTAESGARASLRQWLESHPEVIRAAERELEEAFDSYSGWAVDGGE